MVSFVFSYVKEERRVRHTAEHVISSLATCLRPTKTFARAKQFAREQLLA